MQCFNQYNRPSSLLISPSAQANQPANHTGSSPLKEWTTSAVSNPTYSLDSKHVDLDDIHLLTNDYSQLKLSILANSFES